MKKNTMQTFSILPVFFLAFLLLFLSGCMNTENPDKENFENKYKEPSLEEEQEKMFQDAQSKQSHNSSQ